MVIWRDLDTESALKRLQILGLLSLVPVFVYTAFVLYFISAGRSSFFFIGYAVFEYTSLGIKWGGELVVPFSSATTVFVVVVVLLFLIFSPFIVIGTLGASFTRPFKNVKGFEKFGKVREGVKSFIAQGSKREKLIVAAFTLASITAFLLWSLVLLSLLGISVLNKGLGFLGLLWAINLLAVIYFRGRVEQALKKYAETVQT
ncbi:MAG: hypothetical protein QXR19_01435 [Candidatus Jordarchaeaceae archaeon]